MNLAEQLVTMVSADRRRVLVVGDAMLDCWVHGRVEECQDRCPKFMEEVRHVVPGGAANAHQCLSRWEVLTDLFAILPKERAVKTRFVDRGGEIVYRHDNETQSRVGLDNQCYEWVYDRALEMVRFSGAVLLSDYDKGFLTPEFIAEVVALCKSRSIPCVADCKRKPTTYSGCVRKCNVDYMMRWCCSADVATTGPHPPMVSGEPLPLDLPDVRCINHVGAGDCFAAHLTLALAYGFSLKDAAALAHSAGRVYVQHLHNRPPTPTEIAADLALSV